VCGYYCANVVSKVETFDRAAEAPEPDPKRRKVEVKNVSKLLNNMRILRESANDPTNVELLKKRQDGIDEDELYKQKCKEVFFSQGFN